MLKSSSISLAVENMPLPSIRTRSYERNMSLACRDNRLRIRPASERIGSEMALRDALPKNTTFRQTFVRYVLTDSFGSIMTSDSFVNRFHVSERTLILHSELLPVWRSVSRYSSFFAASCSRQSFQQRTPLMHCTTHEDLNDKSLRQNR